ncbi:tetratricopeptide repeat protein [Flavobacterium sp. RSB2_4_14]|uniref:tetratricopeptide repeat protein n=1 Tax=Flavobacterium sp. RSB2_4_14 TaxID=3447665 RepID=UPI003F2F2B62
MKSSKPNFYFLFIVCFCLTNFSYAQNNNSCGAIINEASNDIYSNPDKVIKIGFSIVKESANNIDCKIKGYKLICDAYTSKRNYVKALEYLNKANSMLPQTNNAMLKIIILNKAGIIYHQLKIYDKAIQYLDQAEQAIMEYPVKDSIHTDLGKNYIVRGFIYKEEFNCDIAINFFNRGITELLKIKSKPAYSIISIAKYNKGNCYILMSKNALAIQNFKESFIAAKTINAKSLQAFANKGLAQVYTLEGNYTDAIAKLNEALVLSDEVEDLVLNQEIYKGLSENYLATSEWEKFKVYHSKYLNVQKLVKKSERESVSESLDLKMTESNNKLKDEKSKFYYFLILSFFILLLIIFLFTVLIKKENKEIALLKKQINDLQLEKRK